MEYDETTDDTAYRYYQRGMVALENGDTDSAEYYLQRAVEMRNGTASSHDAPRSYGNGTAADFGRPAA